MKQVLLITILVIAAFLCKAQSEQTYVIDSAKVNENNAKEWIDITDKVTGNLAEVSFKKSKIGLFVLPTRIFKIIRYLDPIKETKGDTFTFKCMDDYGKACTIYVAYNYAHRENPTLFVQYEHRNEMYYLKNF